MPLLTFLWQLLDVSALSKRVYIFIICVDTMYDKIAYFAIFFIVLTSEVLLFIGGTIFIFIYFVLF